ncbi:hypothetical protein CRUP_002968, partial [Coryphaenoides rupestris]
MASSPRTPLPLPLPYPFTSHGFLPDVSANDSLEITPFEGSSTLVMAVISLTVFAVGLTGNALAIYMVLRHAKMKTVTNVYILNLAVADELYIAGLPFLTTQNVLSYWPFGSFLCRVVMTADSMNQFTSIFFLTVMSIDRYLAVVHPIRSTRWRHPRVAKMVSMAVWAVSFIVVLPVVIFSDVQGMAAILAFFFFFFFFCHAGPVCLESRNIFRFSVQKPFNSCNMNWPEPQNRKVTRMVVVIVVVFVFCWLPFFIINIVNLVVIIPESSAMAGIYIFSVILSYANSCANPLLYAFLSENFKQSFKKVLCVRSFSCKTNGVEDGDPSAPRTEKTTTHSCPFLSARNQAETTLDPQCSQ